MRIGNKKDLPTWFSLKKYSVFNEMSDRDLIYQIIFRYFDSLDGNENDDGYYDEVIKAQSPFCDNDRCSTEQLLRALPNQKISEDAGVRPININDVLRMRDCLEYHKYEITRDVEIGYPLDTFERHENIHFDIAAITDNEGKIHCELDLYCEDDVILTSIGRLLPLWRKQLGIELELENSEIKTSWLINRQKILSYQVIAFYDLTRWQVATGHKITNSVMAASLYPNGEYGETSINQTIKKYIENIFEKNYIRTLITELHKNEGVFFS